MNNISKPTQWLTYSYLVAGLTLSSQYTYAKFRWEKSVKHPYEIRGTVSLREIYGTDSTFEAALSGADHSRQDQEAFVRMLLLNRFRITATVLDRQHGGAKPVGKVTLLAGDYSQYEFRFLITDLPENEPIVVQVEVPAELASDPFLEARQRVFQAVGWTGIALLTPEKPKLAEANFMLRVLANKW